MTGYGYLQRQGPRSEPKSDLKCDNHRS